MRKHCISLLFAGACVLSLGNLYAQDGGDGRSIEPAKPAKWSETTDWKKHPRLEDHYWRKKVRYRIDLMEKPNEPLRLSEPVNLYDDNSRVYNSNKDRYEYVKGVIDALLSAYANNFMTGYAPDTLDNIMEFNEFKAKYAKLQDQGGSATPDESEAVEDEGGDDWDQDGGDDESNAGGGDKSSRVFDGESAGTDFSGIPKYLDVIEDRIFDKNKSDMFYEPEYIILSAKNAVGVEQPIVAFRYEDVKDTVLSKCRWKNRFNDAEYRTVKEIFELRLFDSVIYVIGGDGMNSIDESEKKRQQMVEYEHNLFEF